MVENPQDREAPGRALVESMGGKLHSFFFCFGSEDVVAIIEAPNDETAAGCSLALGASGVFSAGATTKLLTSSEAQEAMKLAGSGLKGYSPPAT
jgi:uncharacterized protein with GYD domain